MDRKCIFCFILSKQTIFKSNFFNTLNFINIMGQVSFGGNSKSILYDVKQVLPKKGEAFTPYFSMKTRVQLDATNQPIEQDGKFVIDQKQESAIFKEVNQQRGVNGRLIKLELKTYIFESDEQRKVILHLEDKEINEFYKVEFGFGNECNRAMWNSILSLDTTQTRNIEVSVGVEKKDDKSYSKCYFKYVGEKQSLSWRFQPKDGKSLDSKGIELPQVTKVKVGRNEVKDSSEQDDFLWAELQILSDAVSKVYEAEKSSRPSTEVATPQAEVKVETAKADADLPF